jgi:putative transcriptional regulator
MELLGGKLLIANAGLFDPNFRRAIVLCGHHDEEGAVGVVLNRALGVSADDAVPPLAGLVAAGEPLFSGGPVQPDAAVVVAAFEQPEHAGVLAFGRVGFLGEAVEFEDVGGIVRARIYAGYTGWGPGQLETELEEDSWVVAPATEDDVFHPEPDRLWNDVLRRLGPRFDLLRLMPEDPSLN